MKITPQMADQAALIVQAFKEGREVLERRHGCVAISPTGGVIAVGNPSYTYELAPKEPAVCWRNEYANGRFGASHSTKEEAEAAKDIRYIRTVKFVEASE